VGHGSGPGDVPAELIDAADGRAIELPVGRYGREYPIVG